MTTNTLSPDQREALKQRLDEIAAAAKPLLDFIAPFQEALRKLDEIRAGVLERAGLTDEPGECEHCRALLLPGDLVCKINEAGELCETCAPTWAEIIAQHRAMTPGDWAELMGDGDGTQADFIDALESTHADHLDAKAVYPKS